MERDKLAVWQNLSDLECQDLPLRRLSALSRRFKKENPNEAWKEQIKWYFQNNHFKELNRIDGMQTEFEWKIFPGFTTLDILEEIQNCMKEQQCEPEQFKDRIIFMSMFNDIAWREKENAEKCIK